MLYCVFGVTAMFVRQAIDAGFFCRVEKYSLCMACGVCAGATGLKAVFC